MHRRVKAKVESNLKRPFMVVRTETEHVLSIIPKRVSSVEKTKRIADYALGNSDLIGRWQVARPITCMVWNHDAALPQVTLEGKSQ